MMDAGMELCDDLSVWQAPVLARPPVEPSWEDMLNAFLQEPEESVQAELETKSIDGFDGHAFKMDQNNVAEHAVTDELLWSGAASDAFPDFCESLFLQDNVSLPGLSSEVSSLVDDECFVGDLRGSDSDVPEASDGVELFFSDPVEAVDAIPRSSSASKDESSASAVPSPIANSPLEVKVSSPDTGCDSSDVGASGKSCDNFASISKTLARTPLDPADEDAKRESRLRRNRESASQSRMRKKSYVKDLEAKCRAMESQLSVLHQTVAFTSAQNAALREELAHAKKLKGNGLKSGAMEPAALPSDSLPSESPSHRITFLTVNLELVVFLYHVLLLMLSLPVLLLSQAASGGNSQNEASKSAVVSAIVDNRQSEERLQRLEILPQPLSRRRRKFDFGDSFTSFDQPFLGEHLVGFRMKLWTSAIA